MVGLYQIAGSSPRHDALECEGIFPTRLVQTNHADVQLGSSIFGHGAVLQSGSLAG